MLTTEKLKEDFDNNFDLALYAIKYGRFEMKAGREVTLDNILELVRRHPNPSYLQELQAIEEMEDE